MACPVLSSPPEILHMVFASLSPSDLCSVYLTHRDLRSLAEPFLYAHIHWTWSSSEKPPIPQFLRSIVHRPELASFVRVVILNAEGFNLCWQDYGPVTEAILDKLVECIRRMHVPYAEQWIQGVHTGTMDAFVALLLSQLPGLRCLYLGKDFTQETHFLGMMLHSALCKESHDSHLPSFTHLQDVSVGYLNSDFHYNYTDVRNTADVLPLFYLPSVESMSTLIDNPATFMWPGTYSPNPSRLTSLDLAMLREGHLSQVLSITQGLRQLQ